MAAGDRRALARAISLVEDRRPGGDRLLALLYPRGGAAAVVGVTGAPGTGKSTLVDRLVRHLRSEQRRVGVVAVDPSSPFTGGALLGDRIRMQDHAADPGVFIRSMSSRGHLGGLAATTDRVVALLDAAGFDPVLVETVGVGQSEVEVARAADTTVVVVTPQWGDGVQAAKAGLLEAGDVFVVNKADLPGVDLVVRDLTQMLELGETRAWVPPVVVCSAATGEGTAAVWEAVEGHLAAGEPAARRRSRARHELERAVAARIAARLGDGRLDPDLVAAVEERRIDPWSAAARLVP